MPALLTGRLTGWRMIGDGDVRRRDDGAVEITGGPGLLWFVHEAFTDFHLRIEWMIGRDTDRSGLFVRLPAPAGTLEAAFRSGYEVPIDQRGVDPETGTDGDPLHRSGAIRGLAPATAAFGRGRTGWNLFEVTAAGSVLDVRLNGRSASRFDVVEPRSGHVGLRAAGDGSTVCFRNLEIGRL